MTKVLFLDESGDHNLTAIDPQHPIFVLGGVIADKEYAFGEMTERLNHFKKQQFGTTDITLHTADFTRQRNGDLNLIEGDFGALKKIRQYNHEKTIDEIINMYR